MEWSSVCWFKGNSRKRWKTLILSHCLLTFTAIDRGITFRGQLQGLPLPQLCATGNAQTRRAGNRRARHEIDGERKPAQERNGHSHRVPALRAESAGFRGDHRIREHGTARSGDGSRAHLPAAGYGPNIRSAHEDEICRLDGKVRTLQDHCEV